LVQEGIKRYKRDKKDEIEPPSLQEERKAFLAEKELEDHILRGRKASLKKRLREVEKREKALQMQVRAFQEKEIVLKKRKKIQNDRERRLEQFLTVKRVKMEEIDKIVLPAEEEEEEEEVLKEEVLTVPLPDSPPHNNEDSDECSLSFAQ